MIEWVAPALVFLAPLPRGLFFAPEQLSLDVAVFAIFVAKCAVLYRQQVPLWADQGRLAFPLGGLVVAYALAAIDAVNEHAAVVGALGSGVVWCVYVIARNLPLAGQGGRRLFQAVVLSATVVAVFGLGLFIGSWEWEGGLYQGRIASTFQYPNTLNAFLIAAAACAVSGSLTSAGSVGPWLYRPALSVMALSFAFAVSRATAVGLPIVIAIHVAFSPRGMRLRTGLEWLGAAIPALVTVRPIGAAVAAGDAAMAWLLVGAAVSAACAVGWFLGWVASGRWPAWFPDRLRSLAVGGMVLIAVAGVAWLVAESAPTLAAIRIAGTPRATAAMAAGREIGPQNLWFRLTVMADAARATLDRPWFGAGGGAWSSLSSTYQRTGYVSHQVHSFPIQLVFETGLVGLVALLLTTCFTLRAIWFALRAFPQGPERAALAGGVAALAAIVGHSLVDFDLSYLSMLLVVSALLGALDGALAVAGSRIRPRTDEARCFATSVRASTAEHSRAVLLSGGTPTGAGELAASMAVKGETATDSAGVGARRLITARATPAAAGLIALALVAFTARLTAAEFYAWRGEQRVAAGDHAGAAAQFERAVRLNPRASPHHRALAEALLNRFLREGDPALAAAAVRAAKTAVAHNRYHADTQAVLARAHLAAGDAEAAVAAAAEAVRLERFQTRHYALLGEARVAAALAALAKGDAPRASAHVAATLDLPERVRSVQAEQRRHGWGQAPAVTPAVSLALGQAEALRGEWTKAEPLLRRAKFEGRLVQQADPWLAWVYDRLGRRQDADALRRRGWVEAAWRDPRFAEALRLAPVK